MSLLKQYFALSQEFLPGRVLQIVCSHWSIENQCHWALDVVFPEFVKIMIQKNF